MSFRRRKLFLRRFIECPRTKFGHTEKQLFRKLFIVWLASDAPKLELQQWKNFLDSAGKVHREDNKCFDIL